MKKLLAICILVFVVGCTRYNIDQAVKKYKQHAPKIQIGDTKNHVLSILEPTQVSLGPNQNKMPEQFTKDNKTVEIYYFRSLRQPDGLTTDDEFTPYVFQDGTLVAIGWFYLGGPKTQGKARNITNVTVQQSGYGY